MCVFVIILFYFDYNWMVCGDFDLVFIKKLIDVFFKFDLVNLEYKEIFGL